MSSIYYASDYEDPCPDCGSRKFKVKHRPKMVECAECGYCIAFGDISSYEDGGDIPFGCNSCGGPYPDCVDSCKLMSD